MDSDMERFVGRVWQKRDDLILFGSVALGTFLRFHGLMWDAPYFFNPDEGRAIRWSLKVTYPSTLPSEWGTAPLYLFKLLSLAASLFGALGEREHYLLARGLAALLSSLVVVLCYLAAKRAYGKKVGVWAAALTAFTVLSIQYAHFYVLDVVMAFFVIGAFYFIVEVAQGGGLRSYLLAGLFIGLATASRVNGLLLCCSLVAAHWLRPAPRSLLDRRLALGLVSVVGTFFLLTPSLLLDPETYFFRQGFLWIVLETRGYFKPQWTLQFEGTTPLYYVSNLLFWSMGPLLEATALLGAIYALRKWKQNAIFLVFILLYFLSACSLRTKFIRYALPALPVLAILAAYFLVDIRAAAKTTNGTANGTANGTTKGPWRWIADGYAGLVLVATLLYALAFANIYSVADTRIEASRWIRSHVEKGAAIILENDKDAYAPPLKFNSEREEDGEPLYRFPRLNFDFLYERSPLAKPLPLPAWIENTGLQVVRRAGQEEEEEENLPLLSDEEKWEYIYQRLGAADYIVFSERNYDSYRRLPSLFPVESEYYRRLFAGELGFELVRVFERRPGLLGLRIDDSWAELTFKIFDHPTIWLFRRRES